LVEAQAVYAHGAGNVLQLLLAEILEGEIEFPSGILLYPSRHANPARVGQAFEPRRNIDAVAKDVAVAGG
jgi:hypothetical protein